MQDRTIVISGLPGSGKTTFLAALWHLVTSRVEKTKLRFESLRHGDLTYLNAIAARWRNGLSQARTFLAGDQLVSMNLLDSSAIPMRLVFPDLAGESFRDMWENRECTPKLMETLRSGDGLLFFVNADMIQRHLLTVEMLDQAKAIGSEIPTGQEVKWHPSLATTQVKLVDLLQLFRESPIGVGFHRIAIVLSLWDKVESEGRSPEDYLEENLPLVYQYLRSEADGWIWKVFGVSAQGGEYKKEEEELTPAQRVAIAELMALDEPSKRIRVITGKKASHDLTEPVDWLIQ